MNLIYCLMVVRSVVYFSFCKSMCNIDQLKSWVWVLASIFLGLIWVETSPVEPALYPNWKKHSQAVYIYTKENAPDNTCLPIHDVVSGDSPTADLLAVNVCLGDNDGLTERIKKTSICILEIENCMTGYRCIISLMMSSRLVSERSFI